MNKDKSDDEFPARWRRQAIYDLPSGDDAFYQATDHHGCYVFKKDDGHHLYYVDETGKVTESLLEDPHEGTKNRMGPISDIVRVASDTIIVSVETGNGFACYCYRIENNKARYLSEIDIPTYRWEGLHLSFIVPLGGDGHFVVDDGRNLSQYSPDPNQDGLFQTHSPTASNGDLIFPRPYRRYHGDRYYLLDNRLFLYSREEGWKIVQMKPGERHIEQLKCRLVQVANKMRGESNA